MAGRTNKLVRKGHKLRDGYSTVPVKAIRALSGELRAEIGFPTPCAQCYMFEKTDTTYQCNAPNDCIANSDHVIVPDEYVVILASLGRNT